MRDTTKKPRRIVFVYCKDGGRRKWHERGHHGRCPVCKGSQFRRLG